MKKYFIIFFIVAFLGAFIFKAQSMVSSASLTKNQPTPPTESQTIDVPSERMFTGAYVCLPPKDTKGTQTLECALGLKVDDGTYVAMDTKNIAPLRFVSGDRMSVSGTFVSVEQLSSNHWQKYPITGILQVKEAKKL